VASNKRDLSRRLARDGRAHLLSAQIISSTVLWPPAEAKGAVADHLGLPEFPERKEREGDHQARGEPDQLALV